MNGNIFDPSQYGGMYGYRQPSAVGSMDGVMTRVFQWMAMGLAVTGVVAGGVAAVPDLMLLLVASPLRWVLLLAMVGMSMALTGFATRMSAPVAFAVFFAYSAVTGAALSPIFYIYDLGSIGVTFLVTAGTFGSMAAYGYATRKDLTSWGAFAMMGLVGLLIASVVNWLFYGFESSMLYWLCTYVGVIVFTVLAAFDTQRIKQMLLESGPSATQTQLSIAGATILYMDFINLFLYLLRIFGGGRDRD